MNIISIFCRWLLPNFKIHKLIMGLLFLLFTNIFSLSYAYTQPPHKLYGGVEIGSKGVKSVVVELIKEKEGYDANIRQSEPINTGITKGMEKTKKFSSEAIADTVKAVKTLYMEIKEKDKVSPDHIYIIGSSGISVAENKEELSEKVLTATGKEMVFISVETEVTLAISGLIPSKYSNTAFLVDIGSGNTKSGYRVSRSSIETKNDPFFTMSVPYGTVTFTDAITKNNPDGTNFVEQADKLTNDLISVPIREEIDRKPGFLNRDRAYLSGGIVWAMTTLLHPANRKLFVRLMPQDIDTFYNQAVNNPEALLNPNLSKIFTSKMRHSLKAKEQAEKDLKRVKDTFTPNQLIAGAKIMQAISNELNLKNKRMYFARQGYIAWLFSYINEAELSQNTTHGNR